MPKKDAFRRIYIQSALIYLAYITNNALRGTSAHSAAASRKWARVGFLFSFFLGGVVARWKSNVHYLALVVKLTAVVVVLVVSKYL